MAHLSESLHRSLYPTAGALDNVPKFSLGIDTPPHVMGHSPGSMLTPNANTSRPENGVQQHHHLHTVTEANSSTGHQTAGITPTHTHTHPSVAPAGATGVWTPQGYVKQPVQTPTTAASATPVNFQTPRPYEARPRGVGIANSQFSMQASRQHPRDPQMIQSNPSAFALPPRRRNDASYTQSIGDMATVPSLLRSILNQENIDYQNDFYWMQQFRLERERDPQALEQSLTQSMLYSQTSLNPNSLMPRNSYRTRHVYDSRLGGVASGNSELDLDLSLTGLGDHPVPSFSGASHFSQLQPSQSQATSSPRVQTVFEHQPPYTRSNEMQPNPTTQSVENDFENPDVDNTSQKVSL